MKSETEQRSNGSPSKANANDDRSPSSPDDGEQQSKSEGAPRQKRKKARRACLACQRAHLTCSDERPCHRCIKRGLQADCHDGMRKKAKYLHDAPNEALMPGVGQKYIAASEENNASVDKGNISDQNGPIVPQDQAFAQDQTVSFNNYPPVENAPQLHLHNTASFGAYGAPSSPISPHFNTQQTSPMQSISGPPMQTPLDAQPYGTFIDANDPSVFNFDLAGMNFGNHYGALEFGMLGHMSSGANDGNMGHRKSGPFESPPMNYPMENSADAGSYLFNRRGSISDWQASSGRPSIPQDPWAARRGSHAGMMDEPSAYSIGALPPSASGTSPGSNGDMSNLDRQYMGADLFPPPQQAQLRRKQSQIRKSAAAAPPPPRGEDGPSETISKKLEKLPPPPVTRKRPRDPSKIYSSVTKPYPYTQGFHALTAVLQRRFSSQKRLRVAQALASIRPSFISCTRTLTDDDLIFMEKGFQRQLWEYEDFVSACGTPTIVCRRTGEVAYAGKEFTTLTGWKKSVLLGSEPNLNVNQRGDISGTMTGSSRGGVNTPRIPNEGLKLDADRPQPVFLAELLDDDNVIEFYEDFAKLAFADSKGSACKPCKLLKYKTKDDQSFRGSLLDEQKGDDERAANGATSSPRDRYKKRKGYTSAGVPVDSSKKGNSISDEAGINKLGDKSGKVDCMYCWTVKRDVFDIPMMIVINFLPILN